MKRMLMALSLLAVVMPAAALAKNEPMVGGQLMFPTRDIVDNAVNSADHATLVAAVKAADLVATLKGAGPFMSVSKVIDGGALLLDRAL